MSRQARQSATGNRTTVYTVGHSTRSLEALLTMLREHAITVLVDVRRFPGSRRHPQFGRDPLSAALEGSGFGYRHEADLGGRRVPRQDSPNTAWRVAGFRGYADHMASDAFRVALKGVLELAGRERVALMCAEAVPWRCHRQLIADELVARGLEVVHILGPDRAQEHRLHPAARRTEDGGLVYPTSGSDQSEMFAGGRGIERTRGDVRQDEKRTMKPGVRDRGWIEGEPIIEPARAGDLPLVLALLERCGLPDAGLADHVGTLLVARSGGDVVGCAALEQHEPDALLRSVAVAPELRGRGLGERLTAAALDLALARRARRVYLLTETAAGFFPRFGFRSIDRAAVRGPVTRSVELATACPASAVVMELVLRPTPRRGGRC